MQDNGLRVTCLATADFDGDGKDDLWSTSNIGGADVITFQANGTTKTDVSGLRYCGEPGDVDADGDIDLIGWIGGSSYIIENTGNLTFNSILLDNSGDLAGPTLIDFDADGDLDIISIFRIWGEWTYDIVLWENQGNGLKGQAARHILDDATFGEAKDLAVKDFNGDGLPDIMVSDDGSNKVYLSLNQGANAIGPWTELPSDFMSSPEGIVAADFDGDGDIDAAVADWIKDGIHVYLNDGNANPSFAQTRHFYSDRILANVHSLIYVDISGDGREDLVANATLTPGSFFGMGGGWMLNNGDGTFGSPTPFSDVVSNNYAITAGDYDGDGDVDIARGRNFGSATDQIVVNYNEPLGELSLADTEWTFRSSQNPLTVSGNADLWFRLISTTGAFYGRTPADFVMTLPDGARLQQVTNLNTGFYASGYFTSTVSGDRNITLTSGGQQFLGPFRFEPAGSNRTKTLISSNLANILADGQSTATITVQVRDAYENNLETGGEAVVLATTLGTLGAVADNGDGTYTATLTAGEQAGDATVSGTLNGGVITDTAVVTFDADGGDPTTTTISANPAAITADGQATSTVTVQAKDANGDNFNQGGEAVVLATTLGALGAVVDNNDGTYTATLTAGILAGTATITGTLEGAAITDNAQVALNPGATAAATTTISANPASITADGQATST
ncbi:MAG: FG-GAP-like repeat-containing protein, partial [Bacteroidota bacterium]|nr:FG-GAP-like repeat-containing protein [Bacteroidota bacterium]